MHRILQLLAPMLLAVLSACGTGHSATATSGRAAVLVFGGSGQLGSQIVQSLQKDGFQVSIFVRPSSKRDRIADVQATLIEGNVLVDGDVQRALQSRHFDVVINALGRSEQPMAFYATSGQLIAKWSKASGVRQVILHSSVGVGSSAKAYPGTPPPFMVSLMREKGIAEQALIDSGVPYTIIRNDTLRDLPADAPENARLHEDPLKLGLVSRRGLARLTRECVLKPSCYNKIYHAVDAGMGDAGR